MVATGGGSSEYLLTLVAWYFVPGFLTNWLQTIYYGFRYRAGDVKPVPGSPQHTRHRRNILTLIIAGYFLFSVYQSDWQLRRDGDFYANLGVPVDADEKAISRLLRRVLAQAHPDKVRPERRAEQEQVFIDVKLAYDTLTDPMKRFAYERFGPDILSWKNMRTLQDYVYQGATSSGSTILLSAGALLGLQTVGQVTSAKYWRYLTLAALLIFEMHTITRPHWPRVLTHFINPALAFLTRGHHPPILPFQLIKLLRSATFSFFIALNQLAPWWANTAAPSNPAQEELAQAQLLSKIKQIVGATNQDSQRLLSLEHAPFRGNKQGEDKVRERLVEWLVQNEVRNDPAVSAAMRRAVEKRNAETVDGWDGEA